MIIARKVTLGGRGHYKIIKPFLKKQVMCCSLSAPIIEHCFLHCCILVPLFRLMEITRTCRMKSGSTRPFHLNLMRTLLLRRKRFLYCLGNLITRHCVKLLVMIWTKRQHWNFDMSYDKQYWLFSTFSTVYLQLLCTIPLLSLSFNFITNVIMFFCI